MRVLTLSPQLPARIALIDCSLVGVMKQKNVLDSRQNCKSTLSDLFNITNARIVRDEANVSELLENLKEMFFWY